MIKDRLRFKIFLKSNPCKYKYKILCSSHSLCYKRTLISALMSGVCTQSDNPRKICSFLTFLKFLFSLFRYGGIDLNARRKNATRETTNTLKAWLYEHRKNPYPTKGEKIMLAIITKMTLTQVSTWFANARRRLKKENKMTWSPRNRSEDDGDNDDSDNDDDMNEKTNDEKCDRDQGSCSDVDSGKECADKPGWFLILYRWLVKINLKQWIIKLVYNL